MTGFTRQGPLAISAFSAALVFLGCASSTASAALVFSSLPGLEGNGSFTGSLSFTATGATTGTLSVSLTNTSPIPNGGYLTAFAFNVVDGVSLGFTSSGQPAWGLLSAVDASPYPAFDYGAGVGSWLDGGAPSTGIAVGATSITAFSVSASAGVLATLTDASFFDGTNGYAFAARFRGFANGGSDKVLGVVPAPGAIALLALAGLASRRRR